jgi:hypothetical protein
MGCSHWYYWRRYHCLLKILGYHLRKAYLWIFVWYAGNLNAKSHGGDNSRRVGRNGRRFLLSLICVRYSDRLLNGCVPST